MDRRQFLSDFVLHGSGLGALAVGCVALLARVAQAACDGRRRTPPQTEGPFYKRNPPLRESLAEPGMAGEPLLVTGRVLDAQCRPIPRASVDFWHADASGEYDTAGYRLRGYQLTDADGRFRLQTILPGVYTGRARHIHVKIAPSGRRTLTTQLYFPNEPENARDGIFDAALVLRMSQTAEGQRGEFDFIVDA